MKKKDVRKLWTHLPVAFVVTVLIFPLSTAVVDEYEPDNRYQNSTIILTDGTEQFHTFENLTGNGEGDEDWVNFNTTAGYYYLIETKNYSDIDLTDTFIFLYSSDGTTLLQQNDDLQAGVERISRIVWFANNSESLYIKIKHFNGSIIGGNYSISVEQQGRLVLSVIPSQDINVTKFEMFNVTANLSCQGGKCYNVSFFLDPERKEMKVFDKKKIDEILKQKGKVDLIIKLKDKKQTELKIKFYEERKQQKRFVYLEKKFKVKRTHKFFNGISGEIDKEGFDKLLLNEDIEAIYYDRPMVAFLNESVHHINTTQVWETQINGLNITGTGQTVCVIDTGINYNHSDFGGANGFPSSKVIGGYDFVNSDGDPWDDHGHGSHVSGIIASEDSVYKGVAPDSKIVAIKSLGSSGSGSSSDIISGIEFCVGNKSIYNISVISMSLGDPDFGSNLPCDYDPIASSIDSAVDAGIIVVSASGNENRGNTNLPGISTPACITNSISVGATGRSDDSIQGFTNRDWFLDVLAPGGSITSTNYVGTHTSKTGTSMATPHVAAAAALMQQYSKLKFNRSLTLSNFRSRIKLFGVKIQDSSTPFSFPRIDALEIVVQKGVIPNITGAEPFYTNGSNPVDCGTLSSGENCSITWWVNATGNLSEVFDFFVFGTATYSAIANSSHFDVRIVDDVKPVFVSITEIPSVVINGTNVTIDASVSDDIQVDSVWANITLPDNSSEFISPGSLPFIYETNGTQIGNHIVTYYVNDTSGNSANTTQVFETVAPIEITLNINITTPGLGITIYRSDTNESLSSSNGSASFTIPNVPVDIGFDELFSSTMETILKGINLSENLNGSIEFGNVPVSGFLTAYGIKTDFNFTSAEVSVSYANASFSEENDLQFHKCDDFTVGTGVCSSGFNEVTSNLTQDQANDKFIFNTTSFSGFGIIEVTPPISFSSSSSGGGSGSGGGGSSGCASGYKSEKGICVKIEEGNVTGIPAELFDISFLLDNNLIQSSDELSTVVIFESFGAEPISVSLTFIILDWKGEEIHRVEDSITVTTEEVLRKSFEGLNLPERKYILFLKTLYNSNVSDEFRQEFEIRKEGRGITGSAIDFIKSGGNLWIGGVIGLFILGILVWWLIRKIRGKKNKILRNSSKIKGGKSK